MTKKTATDKAVTSRQTELSDEQLDQVSAGTKVIDSPSPALSKLPTPSSPPKGS
jgi:hypothetical protein